MPRHVFLALFLLLIPLAGCEGEKDPPAAAPAVTGVTRVGLDVEPITPLAPSRPTHIAIGADGSIFWVQEADLGSDVVFVLDQSGVPRATALSTAAVLRALGATGGTGAIQSLAVGPDGQLYFFFRGGKDRRVLACVGTFDLASEALQMVADTRQVMSATGMSASLDLARGKLFPSASGMWLRVWHSDDYALVHFKLPPDPATQPASTQPVATGPATRPLVLKRPFESITSDRGEIYLTSDDGGVSEAPDGSLIVVDPDSGSLWRVQASSGAATEIKSLVGLPRELGAPAGHSDGRVFVFAGDADPIKPGSAAQVHDPVITTQYPAMLIFNGEKVSAIPSEEIHAYAGFPVYLLNLSELLPEGANASSPDASGESPDQSGQKTEEPGPSWLSYDRSSGELVRVRWVTRTIY